MSAKQVQIVAKIFYFLESRPALGAKVLVITGAAPTDAVIAALRGVTIQEGGIGAASGAFAAFVATPEDARAVTAINPSIMTITGDIDCVVAGDCMVGIQTQPRVAIIVNHVTTVRAGITFDPNFKMLISER